MLDRLEAALGDRYAVERELGRGGMASVWLARDRRFDRPVAIKVLHPELAGAIGVDRFVREVQLTARLQHPNIVPVLDSGIVAGPDGTSLPWYAMAYVPGESLRARLARERQLPVEEALRITVASGSALAAAHREGIVHRDIKPENLLLTSDQVYVADFGIAKALVETGGERLTLTGLAIGTPAYMSPEQASAQPVDARSDQYSLASVLYEMLVGEPPFTGPTAQAIVARRLSEPARAVRPVRPTVPASVEAAVLKGLERIPADRYRDVATFVEHLMRPVPAAASPAPVTSGANRRALGVLLLIVLAVGLGTGLLGRRRATGRDPAVVALYQRGVRAYDQRTPTSIGEAILAFAGAVGRDSAYADAWAGLARTYVRAYERRFVFPGVARDSVLRLAVTAADRALAENPHSAEAWATQASVSRVVDPTDVVPAIRACRRALALDSTNASAWHFLAMSLAERGDVDGALTAWRHGITAHPSDIQGLTFLGIAHYWRRQYDSSARWTDSATAVDPGFQLARFAAGYTEVERGNFARANAALAAAGRLSTDLEAVNVLAAQAFAAARGGASAQARSLLQKADSLATGYAPTPLHTAVWLAEAWAALGDAGHAVGWLQRYSPAPDLHFQLHLRCDPPFAAIENDPRFRALLLTPRPSGTRGC
ncbi:MAG: protein kinase domain-containing protein [Gemmatimonadales bacterium]